LGELFEIERSHCMGDYPHPYSQINKSI